MKRNFLLLAVIALSAFTSKQTTLTKTERDYAYDLLNKTEDNVFSSVKDLNSEQLTYKPSPDRWSVEECLKHIAISEKNLAGMVDSIMMQPHNAKDRAGIKMTDEQLVNAVKDRSHKAQAAEVLKPENSPFKSSKEALDSFKANRDKLKKLIKTTGADMRNHVSVSPLGTYDAYQLVLLTAAHSDRHTQQLKEVMADANFPK